MSTDASPKSISANAAEMGLHDSIKNSPSPKLSKTPNPPTRTDLKLVGASQAIRDEATEQRQALFLATFLIQCTLPCSDPGSIPVWTRTNNEYTLAIQPGWDLIEKRSLGYPYGMLPRLLLIWIVTEAKRTGSRRLELGHSLTEFMHKLDLEPYSRGKKRSDAVRLKDAMRRLFAANIAFYRHNGSGKINSEHLKKTNVADEHQLWWDTNPKDEAVLWGSWIELGSSFFASIMDSVVPINLRAVKALRRSPLALYLYMLCNWIGANLQRRDKAQHFLSWQMLAQQLGGNYKNIDDLKRKVKKEMRKVKLVHPDLRFHYKKEGGGMIVLPSAPAIPARKATIA